MHDSYVVMLVQMQWCLPDLLNEGVAVRLSILLWDHSSVRLNKDEVLVSLK